MNDLVVKQFGTATAAENFVAGLEQSVRSGPTGDMIPLIKMDPKTGDIYFGQDSVELSEDDVLALDIASMEHGYIAFELGSNDVATTENGNRAEFYIPLSQPLAEAEDMLEDLVEEKFKKDGKWITDTPEYKFSYSLIFYVIEGPNAGTKLAWKPTAQGALSSVRKLHKEILARIKRGEAFNPVVSMFSDSYDHKQYGTVWKICIDILDFEDSFEIDLSEFDNDEPEEKPKKRKATKKAPAKKPARKTSAKKQPEPEEEDEPEEEEYLEDVEYEEVEEKRPARKAAAKRAPKRPKRPEPEEVEEAEDEPEEAPKRGRSTRTKRTSR